MVLTFLAAIFAFFSTCLGILEADMKEPNACSRYGTVNNMVHNTVNYLIFACSLFRDFVLVN